MQGGERMKMRSISHVGLTVTNFEEAVKWYHQHFGLLLISEIKIEKDQIEALHDLYHIKDTSARVGFLRAPRGGVIEIFQFDKQMIAEQPTWNRPGFTHVTFDVKNIKKAYKRLKEDGVHFFSEPQKNQGADWVFLKDPDGNLIELIDMKVNYHIIRCLGGLVGKLMKKYKFRSYYNG